MKKTLQIARLELSLLFFSPIAWLLMIVLFFQVAYGFTGAIESLQRAQSWYKMFGAFISHRLFTKTGQGVFSNLLNTLYLYIPLITMSLISRETSSGTIKLLYSSPLKISQLVLGKFIAMMTYNFVLILLMLVIVIGGAISIDHFAYTQIAGALFGIFLLLCAYSAIGLFMSALTNYQVVAAVSTFIVFAFLSYVGAFWQEYDFLRDVTYSLSMPGRVIKMLNGLLTTRDVMYFVVISGVFIAFTISKLAMARDAKGLLYQSGRYLLIMFCGLTVTYLTSRQQFIGYYDATANQRNTLHQYTRDLLKKMSDEPIEITEYVNLYDGYGKASPALRISELDRWEPYLRFNPNIKLKWVYYYNRLPDPSFFTGENKGKTMAQIAEKLVKYFKGDFSSFKSPEEMAKLIDLKGEDYRLVMQVKYKGKTNFLRVFQDQDYWPAETEIATTLNRFMVKVPKLLFVNDGYERSINKIGDTHYRQFANSKPDRHSLVNMGFDVDSTSLTHSDIPEDLTALVIADRRTLPNKETLAKLNTYLDRGGNLFLAAEPSKRDLNNKILNMLGLNLKPGTIVQPTTNFSQDKVTAYFTPEARRLLGFEGGDLPILMPGVSGLIIQKNVGFKITPLLRTDPSKSWNINRSAAADSANVAFEPQNGDQRASFSTAFCLTRTIRGKQQKIIVTADADFLSNSRITQGEIPAANSTFPAQAFKWFAGETFPITIPFVPSRDNAIKLSEGQIDLIKFIYLGVIPGLLLALGSILLIRRKRK